MALFSHTRWMPVPARFGAIAWLSFLMAVGASGVFFSAVDPQELGHCVDFLPEISRTGAYTIGFFAFWLFSGASGLLAVAFTYPSGTTPETHLADERSNSLQT